MLKLCILFVLLAVSNGRRHTLELKNDRRSSVLCSQFGFFKYGILDLNMEKLDIDNNMPTHNVLYGFTLDKSANSGVAAYLETKVGKCFLTDKKTLEDNNLSAILMKFNLKTKQLTVERVGDGMAGVDIMPSIKGEDDTTTPSTTTIATKVKRRVRDTDQASQNSDTLFGQMRSKFQTSFKRLSDAADYNKTAVRAAVDSLVESVKKSPDLLKNAKADLNSSSFTTNVLRRIHEKTGHLGAFSSQLFKKLTGVKNYDNDDVGVTNIPLVINKDGQISVKILVTFPRKKAEGLYTLYFHNCAINKNSVKRGAVNLTLNMVEKNQYSYLSAGNQPLPYLYFIFCIIYVLLTLVWFFYLKTSKHMVYKLHYLMLLLIFTKALSLLFHGMNFYFLGKEGIHEEGWAVMYYITHLVKGALLFVTIVLIGAGWAFVKHMLSKREKKVFLIIIPLQILANVATIIIEESEQGTVRYTTWKEILILVDLLCCGAILFPVIWSIRHLKEASETDGKAAINLQKLKLFRHFYIMIICYIYFTRIIVYLLNITVPFAYTWVVEFFKELATLLFLGVTYFKFRPVPNNPYLLVPQEEEDAAMQLENMQHAWSQSGATDGVVRLKHDEGEEETDVEEGNMKGRQESSHEYD